MKEKLREKLNSEIGIIKALLVILAVVMLLLFLPMMVTVYADDDVLDNDTTENRSDNNASDSDYNNDDDTLNEIRDRINALKERLEELGYQIDEDHEEITRINETLDGIEEEHLTINDKLDLLIIGLSDLIDLQTNFYADETENNETVNNMMLEQGVALDSINEHIDNIEIVITDGMEQLHQDTVSGNSIISDFDDHINENLQLQSAENIAEFNKTLTRTNYFLSLLFWILVIGLAAALVIVIVKVVSKVFYNNLV